MRVLATLVLAVFLGQAVGLSAIAAVDGCDVDCPDDDEGGPCPPICPSCACPSHARPSMVPGSGEIQLIDERPVPIAIAFAAEHLPCPDPREILHVPKAASA